MSINLEYTAEDLISHKLQRASILIAKPKFDIEGTDLIAFIKFRDATKIGRIQSKGRTLVKGTTSIEIPEKYVYGAFFIFVYYDVGIDNTNLYLYTVDDIKQHWKISKDGQKYRLNVKAKDLMENLILKDQKDFLFTDAKIPIIKKIIASSKSETENLMMQAIEIQKELAIKKEKANKLEKYITEYKHQEEKLAMINASVIYLEEQLKNHLSLKVELLPLKLKEEVVSYYKEYPSMKDVIKKYGKELSSFFEKEIMEDILEFLFKENLIHEN